MDTERRSPRYSAIDLWSPADILDAMLEGQFAAVAAVHAARPAIERAALAIEARLREGSGRLVYAGAGTAGRGGEEGRRGAAHGGEPVVLEGHDPARPGVPGADGRSAGSQPEARAA